MFTGVCLLLLLSFALDCSAGLIKGPLASLSQFKPGPYTVFKTEPLFVPSAINVTVKPTDSKLLAPGYVFIAPHLGSNGWGPQIIDNDGNLVWYGNTQIVNIEGKRPYGMDLTVCDFQGEIGTHLCWSEGRPSNLEDQGIKAGGVNRIFNHHYESVVKDFREFGALQKTPNPHEFNVLPGGETFLQSVYLPLQMDLRPYAGDEDGWVNNGCFQEIDIRQRKAIFEWCYLDHFPIWDTYLYLNIEANTVNASSGTSGKGREHSKWDFMHLNSVDKNEEGDYIVSGRHLSQLIKIAGPSSRSGLPPGTPIWRVNGKHSDFEIEEAANFGRQHHCRFVSTGPEETVVSIFNNAFDGTTGATRNQSAAMILRLNNQTMTAKVEAMYESPEGQLSFAQGSTHIQPNGNVHVGWGSYPEWSEFSANGTLLYHAKAYVDELEHGKLTNYRSFKFPWVGRPKTSPKLVAYCKTCNMFAPNQIISSKEEKTSPLVAYVSWNGATEVVSWRFSVSARSRLGPWIPAGTFARDGFETKARLNSFVFENMATFASWVRVEALDNDGNVLGRTESRTFVPNDEMQANCGIEDCDKPFRFAYEPKFSRSQYCQADFGWITLWVVLSLFLIGLESWERLYYGFMTTLVYPEDDSEKDSGLYESVQNQSFEVKSEKG